MVVVVVLVVVLVVVVVVVLVLVVLLPRQAYRQDLVVVVVVIVLVVVLVLVLVVIVVIVLIVLVVAVRLQQREHPCQGEQQVQKTENPQLQRHRFHHLPKNVHAGKLRHPQNQNKPSKPNEKFSSWPVRSNRAQNQFERWYHYYQNCL